MSDKSIVKLPVTVLAQLRRTTTFMNAKTAIDEMLTESRREFGNDGFNEFADEWYALSNRMYEFISQAHTIERDYSDE